LDVEASTTDRQTVGRVGPVADLKDAAYHLHPTAIDAVFQLVLVAIAQGLGRNMQRLTVPTLVEEIDVFANPRGATSDILATALIHREHIHTTAEAASNGQTIFRLRGLRLSTLDNMSTDIVDRHAACRLTWHPHVDFVDPAKLIKPPDVGATIRIILEELTLLCVLDSEEVASTVEPHEDYLGMLKSWFQRSKTEALEGRYSFLESTADLLAIKPEERQTAIEARYRKLRHTALGPVTQAVLRVHKNTKRLLTGEVEAIQLLTEGGLLADAYLSLSFDFSSFVKSMGISKPGLRILEVGAGTGGTTASILEGIIVPGANPPYATYTFTDLSAGFFGIAKEKFSFAPNMEFANLDITIDPAEQGFDLGSYDLIIASNVIHAVPSLNTALVNLRALLRRGGHLLMMEVCGDTRLPGYIFGNFSGWWLGGEDNRLWQPSVSVERWDSELKAAGFSGVDSSVLDTPAPYHMCAAMLSRAPPTIESANSTVAILHQDPTNLVTQRLVGDLRARGRETVMVRLGERPPPDAQVIAMLDHEAPFFQGISEGSLCLFQDLCRNYQSKELLWVMPPTRIRDSDPRSGQTLGMLGVVRNETSLPLHTLEIAANEAGFSDLIMKVMALISRADDPRRVSPDDGFVVDKGVVKVARLEPLSLQGSSDERSKPSVEVAKDLEIAQVGLLSSIHWKERCVDLPGENEVVIDAKAVGLNFKVSRGARPHTF